MSKGDSTATVSARAGLVLPIRRVEALAKAEHEMRQGKAPTIVLAGATEKLARELVANSIAQASKHKRSRVTAEYINEAVMNHAQLGTYFGDVSIQGSSLHAHIPDYNKKTNKQELKERKRREREAKKAAKAAAAADGDDGAAAASKKKKSPAKKAAANGKKAAPAASRKRKAAPATDKGGKKKKAASK